VSLVYYGSYGRVACRLRGLGEDSKCPAQDEAPGPPLCRSRLRRARRSSLTGARDWRQCGVSPPKLQECTHFQAQVISPRLLPPRRTSFKTHECCSDRHTPCVPFLDGGAPRDLRQHCARQSTSRTQASPGPQRGFAAIVTITCSRPTFCNPRAGWKRVRSRDVQHAPIRLATDTSRGKA